MARLTISTVMSGAAVLEPEQLETLPQQKGEQKPIKQPPAENFRIAKPHTFRMVGVQTRGSKPAVRRFRAPVVDLPTFETVLRRSPGSTPSIQHSLNDAVEILACPRCSGDLEVVADVLTCRWCTSEYPSAAGIPQLFFPHDVLYGPADVTQRVKTFYEQNPFPHYEGCDSAEALRERMLSASPLARLLDEQLPANARILDAGCGTGHLANLLAMQPGRKVMGGDLSINSLNMAKRFKDRCGSPDAGFVQMNLFRPPFRQAVFDVVIANSVLHHTSDPLRGLATLARLLKPDGLFVLSVYNPLGRAGNRARKLFHHLSKDKLAFLSWRSESQRGRFTQRYKQPFESRHSLAEITGPWFAACQFEFVYSSPRIGSRSLSGGEDLRYSRWPGDRGMQWQTEFGMFLRGLVNDGLFVIIGRNKAQLKQIEAGSGESQARGAVAA